MGNRKTRSSGSTGLDKTLTIDGGHFRGRQRKVVLRLKLSPGHEMSLFPRHADNLRDESLWTRLRRLKLMVDGVADSNEAIEPDDLARVHQAGDDSAEDALVGLAPREMRKRITLGCGQAARDGRVLVTAIDFPADDAQARRVGF